MVQWDGTIDHARQTARRRGGKMDNQLYVLLVKKMASVLNQYEPEKKRGGSEERRAWLKAVMACQLAALELRVEDEFEAALMED